VPDHDFLFALNMSADPPVDMLAELARTVLGQVGYPAPAVDALTGELRAALMARPAGGQRRCDVRFIAAAGELQIVMSGSGQPDWQITRPLPAS
jgi:hypothetical protein